MLDLTDSWLRKTQGTETPDLVDDWLKQTEPPDLVDEWIKKSKQDEDVPRWKFEETAPKPITEKVKDIYQWMYPQGIENLPYEWGMLLRQGGMAIGEGATYLARLAPNQEDLPSYAEQDVPRQALTLAQATSAIALAGLIGYSGFTAISSLVKYLAYGKADKIAGKFATQHFAKIKKLNPEVKTLEDAKALSQAALRGIVQPKVDTTYLPTTISKLQELSNRLLQPLPKAAPTSEFKANMVQQVINFFNQAGIKPAPKALEPFIKTIEHYTGSPKTGMITLEYGQATVDTLNKFIAPMIDSVIHQGGAVIPFEEPKIPEEQIVDEQMLRPLTETPEEYAALEAGKEIAKEVTEPGGVEALGLSIKEIKRGQPPTFPSLNIDDAVRFSEEEAQGTLSKIKDFIGRNFYRNYALRFNLNKTEADMLFRNFFSTRELREKDTQKWLQHTFGTITTEDAIALSLHQEMPEKYPIPDRLKSVAQKQTAVYEFFDKVLQSHDVYREPFPQSMITRSHRQIEMLKQEITYLKQPQAIKRKVAKIKQLEELTALLATVHYLPHQYHGRIHNLIIEESADKDVLALVPRRYSNVLRPTFKEIKKRKIPTLEQAAKEGFVPELDARTIMGKYLLYVQEEIAKAELAKKLIEDPDLALPEDQNPGDWQKVALRPFKGYVVHPALVDAMEEVAGIRGKTWEPLYYWAKVTSIAKRLKFYIPTIMIMNNIQQSYLAAGPRAALDPKLWNWSIKQLSSDTPLYREFIKRDLFPTPPDIRPSRKTQDEMVMMWVRHMDKNYPRVARAIEKATNGEWNFKGKNPAQALGSSLKGAYNMLWNVTWTADRIQRMNTAKRLMDKGMKLEDAVERARFFHVDYADLPQAARRMLNLVLLTPTYRIGMAKVYGSMFRHPIKYKGPLSRLLLAWFGIAAGATVGGYQLNEFYRARKKIEGDKEHIVVIPGPIAEIQKYLGRGPFGQFNLQSSVPIYVWYAIDKNRDWKGDPVYYPGSPGGKPEQATQVAYFILKNAFPPLEGIEMLTSEQQDLRDRLLRFLAVSAYTRERPEIYQYYRLQRLKPEARAFLLWKYPKEVYPEGPPLDAIQAVEQRALQRGENLLEQEPSGFDIFAQTQKGLLWGLEKVLR